MAHKQTATDLASMLFNFMNQPDSMFSMIEWLCEQLMEAGRLAISYLRCG